MEKSAPTQEQLLANTAEALRLIGEAGKILDQMEEFWRNGTPIHPGSLLAQEFSEWGKRIMVGPMRYTPPLVAAAPELLEALQEVSERLAVELAHRPTEPREDYSSQCRELDRARAAIAKAEGK